MCSVFGIDIRAKSRELPHDGDVAVSGCEMYGREPEGRFSPIYVGTKTLQLCYALCFSALCRTDEWSVAGLRACAKCVSAKRSAQRVSIQSRCLCRVLSGYLQTDSGV